MLICVIRLIGVGNQLKFSFLLGSTWGLW